MAIVYTARNRTSLGSMEPRLPPFTAAAMPTRASSTIQPSVQIGPSKYFANTIIWR